jgi:predicted peptidase
MPCSHRTLPLLALLFCAAPAVLAQPAEFSKEPATAPGHYKYKFISRTDGKPVQMTYLVILPKGYDPKAEQKWPLLVFMHGAGECGTDAGSLYAHGPAMELQRGAPFSETFPFIVLCPQCPPRGERWDQPQMYKMVPQIIDKVLGYYRADPDRVYLTGLSMGGKGTWLTALEAPEKFAAIAPICAGHTIPPEAAAKLKYVAIDMISGTLDPDAVNHNNEMFKLLQGNLADVRNTIVPGADHGVWYIFYANTQFYEWLLSHKRPTAAERREMEAAGPYLQHKQAPPRSPGHYRLSMEVQINGQPVPLICSLYLPKNYSPTGQAAPLLLFLHEYNTIGTPFKGLTLHGPDAELEKAGNEAFKSSFPFVLFSPRLPAGLGDWSQKPIRDAVLKALDELTKNLNVDKSRIYATGLNEGGAATGPFALEAPAKFAALAPILAAYSFPNSTTNNASLPGETANLKDVAVWAQCGDASVLNALKPEFVSHPEWKITATAEKVNAAEALSTLYKNPELYDWLLKQKRTK